MWKLISQHSQLEHRCISTHANSDHHREPHICRTVISNSMKRMDN